MHEIVLEFLQLMQDFGQRNFYYKFKDLKILPIEM